MSFKSVILLDGFAAKLPLTNAFSELNYTTSGILREFKFKNTKFRYFGPVYFPRKKQTFKRGYHDVTKVNNYFDNNGVKISDLKPFDFTPYLSKENETVSTKFIDYGEPYTAYHKMKLATFQVKLEGNPPTKRKEYLDPENFEEILFPSGTTYTDLNTSFPDSNPRKHFYKINFGDRINAWTNCDKRKLCRVYTQIALTQSSIVSVFDTFPAITKIDNVGKGIAGTYNDLLLSEKIIYDLKLSWGYYFEFGKAATPLFDNAPNETEADAYLNSLKNFLYNITINKNAIINMSELSKVVNLFYILPSSAMSIISIPNRVKAIDFILKHTFVNQTDEYSILKIIYSVQSIDANEFLDALVSESNNDLLMRIYDKMDDVRLGRYFFINLFVFEKSNKRYFCEAIYNLWKYSNYSPYLADSNGDFAETVNLNCKFINDALTNNGYTYAAHVEFKGNKLVGGGLGYLVYQNKKFETDVKYKRVQLYEVENNTYKLNLPPVYTTGTPLLSALNGLSYTHEVSKLAKASYHYFEPIHLVGFTPDEELAMPKAPAVPAFLFHYANDFDKLKTFDNRLNLAVELAADFALNYFTGGLASFRYLGHMKYASKILNVYAQTKKIPPGTSVMLWRWLDVTSDLVTVSAQNLTIFFDYLKKEDPNSEFAKAAYDFFFWASIISGGMTIIANRKAIGSANKFLDEIENLPPQKYAQIPTEVKNAVAIIKGKITLLRSEFDGFLNQAENTVVKNKYLALPNLESRDAFMLDFIGTTKTNKGLWKSFNADATMVDRWKDLYDLKLAERLELEVLTNNELVLGIMKFYPDAGVKLVLQKTTDSARKAFLTKFSSTSSTIENAFKSNSDLVSNFARFYNDSKVGVVFYGRTDVEIFKFLEKYGDITENTFKNLKTPWYKVTSDDKVKRLFDFPDAVHDIAYFNTRRADMLPPGFGDIATKQMCRIHEIDSFIEIELQFGGKARASLSNEAGDIIMVGGTLNGKSLDPLGLAPNAINPWKNNFAYQFGGFKVSIDRHFEKIFSPDISKPPLDKVVIDFKYMDQIDPTLKQQVLDYIQLKHQQYNNSTYLIKLNL
ncbi:MAG: hypothetical protein ACK44D_01995 [Bacteroidia bacterium]